MATALSIFADRFRKAVAAVGFGVRSSATQADGAVPLLTSGSAAPSAANPNGSLYLRTAGGSATTLYARVAGGWEAIQSAVSLSATTSGNGASLIGVEDAAGSMVATNVETALAELSTPISLSAAAEAGNNIDITMTGGPAHVARYLLEIRDEKGQLIDTGAAFTAAVQSGGSLVGASGGACLIFDSSAAGGAVLRIHDVIGGSGETKQIVIWPLSAPGGTRGGSAAHIAIEFD